ncbi:MAG: phage tail spike protein [Bacillota bacterium]|nr:phage tail spike protein [Bacillota bacterium]
MLQLYDVNHTKICGLKNYKDYNIQKEINQLDSLSFLYPISDPKANMILEECYIQTKDNEYLVKEINCKDDDWLECICKVNVEGIKGTPVDHYEAVSQTCVDSVNFALVGTGWSVGSCDVTKKRSVKKVNCTAYDILAEIQTTFGCEITFDAINKKVYLYKSMGTDKGVYFAEQLNLSKIDIQRNSYSYITRLIPIGNNGLTITSVNGGKNYVENKQYSNKVITAYWEDNRYTVASELLEDSIVRLDYLSKPLKAYKANIIDLASCNSKYSILDYDLGDTITLLAKSKNAKEKQRIVKITQYPEEPERNTIEIANKIARLEDLNVRFEDTSNTVDTVTTSDGMVEGSKINAVDWAKVQNVSIMTADIQDLSVVTARIGTLEATSATITQLNTSNAKIDNLTANKANITDLNATNARIGTLEANSATITQLNATNANITNLQANVASINTLLAGNVGASNLAAGTIQAGSSIIANGAIGSAQISSLSASKISAGTIDTTQITIAGSNSRLKISGNRLQVFAGATSLYERVALGDVNGDGSVYGFRVRGADGTTVLLDETGVRREGITDGSINNAKIGLDANISGTKLDINSVVATINNSATTTIQGSKIYVNNSTLDVQFSALNTTVTAQGQTISSQGSQITALSNSITLKVSTSDFTTYQTSITNSFNATNSNVTALTTRMSTAESGISVLQNQIILKVSQIDIDNSINSIQVGGRNLIENGDFSQGVIRGSGTAPTNWNFFGARTVIYTGQGNTGYNSPRTLYIGHDTVDSGIKQNLNLSKSTQYTMSFTLAKENVSNVYTNITYYDSSNNVLSTTVFSYDFSKSGKQSFTFTTPSTFDHCTFIHGATAVYYANGFLTYFGNVKLEQGNKATDWTPATEDVQGQIDSATTRITNTESSITQLNNSITLKVATSDFTSYQTTVSNNIANAQNNAVNSAKTYTDGQISAVNSSVTNLTTRITTAESSISVLQSQITLKVTQSDIDNSISTIQIGGRNIIQNSHFRLGTANWTGISKTGIDTIYGSVVANLNSNYYSGTGTPPQTYLYTSDFSLLPNTTYTITVVAGGDSNVVGWDAYILGRRSSTASGSYNYIHSIIGTQTNTVYQKFTATFTTASDETYAFLRIDNNGTKTSGTASQLWVAWVKLEQGSKSTDWTPATEDVDNSINTAQTNSTNSSKSYTDGQISTVNTSITSLTTRISTAESSISVLQNQITLKVTQTDINNSINSIQVGGRNLIRNSCFSGGLTTYWNTNGSGWSLIADSGSPSGYSIYLTALNGGYWYPYTSTTVPMILGQQYTISIRAKGTGSLYYGWEGGRSTINVTSTYTQYSYTFTYTGNYNFSFYGNSSGCSIYIHSIQLEVGNKATDWSPAPEDTQSQINTTNSNLTSVTSRVTTAESSISILQGQITSKVDSNGVQSIISQSASQVQVAFNGIASNVTTIDSSGLKVSHSNGDYTKMEAAGLTRYSSSGNTYYHYLTATGSGTVNGSVTIQLPSQFKGKTFVVSVAIQGTMNNTTDSYLNYISCYVSSYDYTNGKFTVSGYNSMGHDYLTTSYSNGYVSYVGIISTYGVNNSVTFSYVAVA